MRKRRGFFTDLIVYLLVNALLIVIWAVGTHGFFWPIFVIAGWGLALLLHARRVFFPADEDEDRIKREMDRMRGAG